jgi:hypothetical protein
MFSSSKYLYLNSLQVYVSHLYLQILEHYALIASQSDNLEKFLMQCFENTISEFKILAQGVLDTLKSKLPIKNIDFAADNSYDEKFLSRMYFANVDLSDPEFHRCFSTSIYILLNNLQSFLTNCLLCLQ